MFLFDGDAGAALTIVLAHGAGASMDSPFMAFFAEGLANRGYRVARFEFPYMASRRAGGNHNRRPPDPPHVLMETWRAVIAELGAELGPERLVIGGKSLGGRIASMVADDAGVRGLVCLGYPFHPPEKQAEAEDKRIAHLKTLRTPALIVQGTRDAFGMPEEVRGYGLSPAIRVHWLEDGDHNFAPRRKSGLTRQQNVDEALQAIACFLRTRCGAG
ncbi:MAG TPA: alpha/beta fold hydrolase [Rhodospirillales bacterium]|nr:alpha/beta fold hydrolase [Rhodospirillales bacterium]